ncbi:MAG: hydrogenase maturation protease [Tepidisphaeraceae bacterium]|jgi:hydrogenase maturation protease
MPSIETDAPVLVIGYGNVLRGDDGAGPAAAEELRDHLPLPVAKVLAVHQLLPELVEPLSRSKLAIFIDADWETPAGQVRKKKLTPTHDDGGAIGHHQSPENLLNMACDVYGHAPPAVLFKVGGADFGFQQGLSSSVRHAMPQLVREVLEAVINATESPEHTDA